MTLTQFVSKLLNLCERLRINFHLIAHFGESVVEGRIDDGFRYRSYADMSRSQNLLIARHASAFLDM